MKTTLFNSAVLLLFATLFVSAQPPEGKNWKLVWQDDFNYPNADLDKEWISQNSSSTHVACSRWRENAVVKDGILSLVNKKEKRGDNDWTSGSIWTKKLFKYGYFECRYKYAKHPATNNSFWLMTQWWQKNSIKEGKAFEIDINEGWYPDIFRATVHNWTDLRKKRDKFGTPDHYYTTRTYCLSPDNGSPWHSIELEKPIKTSRIRFSSQNEGRFHLREIRAWQESDLGYPDIRTGGIPPSLSDLKNYAKDAKITATSPLNENFPKYPPSNVIDGKISTSWITSADGEKFIELDFGQEREIGCVQFLTGWESAVDSDKNVIFDRAKLLKSIGKDKDAELVEKREKDGKDHSYVSYIYKYKLEYWDGSKWVEFAAENDGKYVAVDLSEDYYLYGLEWNEDEIVFYFNGVPYRRIKNEFCYHETPIWLSLAILWTLAPLDDSLHLTHMDVDYVKVWQDADDKKSFMRDRTPDELKVSYK